MKLLYVCPNPDTPTIVGFLLILAFWAIYILINIILEMFK